MRNITFDQEKLSAIIVAYKKYFPSHWKDEMYKWEAVQHFQKYWDVNAQNFLDMFMEATDKTYNLLANMNNYPRGMIKSFSTVDPEAVRSMFIQLFDESKELSERIDHFMSSAEELRVKYDDGTWKQHYQTANAISTYLWLKYPDKYYIYKYSEVRAVARKIDSDFVPKKGSSAANIENSFKLYNEIREILADDRELDKMFKSVLNESCYPDPRKITMTLDLGFFVNRFYNQEKEFNLDALHSDARFSKWYAPVVETLYKMGGSGKRPDIHQKIIEDYGITDDELKSVNSTGNAQVLNDIDWARNYLVYEGILDKGENGVWILTELGKKVIITDELAGKLTNGIFYRFCMTAADHPEKDYYFIIDEINRGNMSKIFGELLMLIEKDYRGTKATLAYSSTTFSVPKNLYMIGMMNTADRSLAMIDYALRRRFSFYEMEPGFHSEGFKAYQASLQNETFNVLIEQIVELNREINADDSLGAGFRIGHSYFCGQKECTEEWMKSVVYYDIIPMLQEYWFDDRQKVQRWENLLIGVFND